MRVLVLLIAVALSGCVTDDRVARLKPYIGQSMAQFSRNTGMVPTDSYATAQGRVFVVNGAPLAVAVAPGIVATGGCKMLIDTAASTTRGTADDWQIVEINATGPC